ncbi:hypothetical protein NEFER03_0295 [Nematocida sp. LUAm3]|nr:hypothetical protein NEFER03_0295 [Nematocida sp. LUAm3]KAI5173747.1 hypothetical protein NEFER02_0263 [Nematocida sp. LUAm2]KAI5176970.1 hypothetical protein NEFER01_0295 [Nematocida sp. LUAm1]
MRVLAVVDASSIIEGNIREVEFTQGYIPSSVHAELKCEKSRERLLLYEHKIQIRDPKEESIEEARKAAESLGHTALSLPDIHLAALALEISKESDSSFSSWISQETLPNSEVITVTNDMVLKQVISCLGVMNYDGFYEGTKNYLQKCFTCNKIYMQTQKVDFCKKCGYSTISRVSYRMENGEITLNLKKDYVYQEKKIYHRGKEIKSQDQKEYKWYKTSQRKNEFQEKKQVTSLLRETKWELE